MMHSHALAQLFRVGQRKVIIAARIRVMAPCPASKACDSSKPTATAMHETDCGTMHCSSCG